MHFNGIQSFKKWVCLSIASMGLVACGGGSADGKTAAASGANNQAAASGQTAMPIRRPNHQFWHHQHRVFAKPQNRLGAIFSRHV
jgi:hypothetical protein